MEEELYDFSTKDELLNKLRNYANTPDDYSIRFKKKIEKALLECPELLYALNNKELESELFNEDGTLNTEGEWDRYFGKDSNIRPYLYIPQTQESVSSFLCYQTHFDSHPRYNDRELYGEITFHVFVQGQDCMDTLTGIPRHDLIASILREKFSWSNIFGLTCEIIENSEGLTDTHYLTRTLTMQVVVTKNMLKTENGKTGYINYMVRK